jgi:hypothetical protein
MSSNSLVAYILVSRIKIVCHKRAVQYPMTDRYSTPLMPVAQKLVIGRLYRATVSLSTHCCPSNISHGKYQYDTNFRYRICSNKGPFDYKPLGACIQDKMA